MDKDRLLGSVLRGEVRARNKREKEAGKAALKTAQAAERKQAEATASQQRQDAFEGLAKRNTTVIDRVRTFTEGGAKWEVPNDTDYDITKQGKVVVLAPVPKTKIRPDHVAVCLVSLVESRTEFRRNKPEADKTAAQFRFAFVPKDRLNEVLEVESSYPLGAIPDKERMTRDEDTYFDEGRTASLSTRGRELNQPYNNNRTTREEYREDLLECTALVETTEQSLEWVLQAAADPNLNPHLQVTAEKLNLQKPIAS